MSLREMVRQERTDFLTFLETLTPAEWEADSMCAGWRIRDLLAHVVVYDSFRPSLAWQMVRAGFSVDRLNLRTVYLWRAKSPSELLDRLRENPVPVGITRLIGWKVALQEAVVHHQDVRRPLGRAREIPAERIEGVLGCLLDPPFLAAVPNHAKGLRLEASDIAWQSGEGPLVTGRAEAIMMALAGRPLVLGELAGPGVDVLKIRLTRVESG